MFIVLTTEAINPLYIGAHSVGPATIGNVEPSGAPMSQLQDVNPTLPDWVWGALPTSFPANNAASNCSTSGDGVEASPLPVAASGWWTDVLCAYGHDAWSSFAAQAGRTATIEVTALDESGLATTAKAMPQIGVWAATDPAGTLPTIAATPSAFNTIALGMTATGLATTQSEGLRFVIADARGDGRPDFAYQARVLYADSIQAAITSVDGGQITITGMGFRAGNEVTVNGIAAVVSSWSANTIVAVAPPEGVFPALPSGPVDIEVIDLSTGGTTVMTGALTYGNVAPDEMILVSAPPGTGEVGTPAAVPFAVRVVLGDGVTPVAGLPVTFSVLAGSAQFGGCAAMPCAVITDATGLASTTVTPTASGVVTVQAAAVGAVQTATFQAVVRSVTAIQPVEYIAAGAVVAWTPQVSVLQNGAPAAGVVVVWNASGGMTVSPASSLTNALGIAQTAATAGPLAAGTQASGQACAWVTVCANFAAIGVDPSAWRVVIVSGAGQTVPSTATFAPVVAMVTDGGGDPVAGAPVAIYQTVEAGEMPCPARGACPIAPVIGASSSTAVSDVNGLVSAVPMQVTGVDEVTKIAVATGTQGFASLSLEQQP
jgi:hypothetical protein